MSRPVKLSELQIRDVVRFGDGPYNEATVKKVDSEGTVTFFRPYVATSDFDYTGGVICTIGIEEFTMRRMNRNDELTLVQRSALKVRS